MIPPLIREKHGRCLYRDFDGLIARTARLCPVFQRILTKKAQSKSDSSSDPAPRLSVWHDVFFRFFLPPQIVKRLQFILPPNTTCFGGFFRKMVRATGFEPAASSSQTYLENFFCAFIAIFSHFLFVLLTLWRSYLHCFRVFQRRLW